MENTATKSRDTETIHRWVVLLSSTLVTMISFGLMLSFGSVFLPLLDAFGETRAATAVVQSLLIATGTGFGVIAGWLITRFGVSKVAFGGAVLVPTGFIVGYFAKSLVLLNVCAVISGMGINSVHISGIVAIGHAFQGRHQTFAVSIQSVGTPLAGFVFPPLITLLNKMYRLRGMYLILGGILLNNLAGAIVFAYVTEPSKSDKKLESDKENNDNLRTGKVTELQDIDENNRNNGVHLDPAARDCFNPMELEPKPEHQKRVDSDLPVKVDKCTYSSENNSTILQAASENKHKHSLFEGEMKDVEKRVGLVSFSFVMFIIAASIMCAALASFLTLYQDMMKSKGFTVADSNVLYIYYSSFNLVSRGLPMIPNHFPRINIFTIPLFAAICGFLCKIVLLLTTSYTAAAVAMSFGGLCDGALISSMQAIVFVILLPEKQPLGLGISSTASGLLATGAGPAFGAIRDVTESYDVVLMINAGLYATCMMLFITCIVRAEVDKCLAKRQLRGPTICVKYRTFLSTD